MWLNEPGVTGRKLAPEMKDATAYQSINQSFIDMKKLESHSPQLVAACEPQMGHACSDQNCNCLMAYLNIGELRAFVNIGRPTLQKTSLVNLLLNEGSGVWIPLRNTQLD